MQNRCDIVGTTSSVVYWERGFSLDRRSSCRCSFLHVRQFKVQRLPAVEPINHAKGQQMFGTQRAAASTGGDSFDGGAHGLAGGVSY